MVEPAVRVRARRRRVLDRLLDDAQQEEPGSGRARPRPGRPRHRRADRDADAAQGPAARLPARPPGGQGAAVRRRGDVRGVARRHGRPARDADRRPRRGCARPPTRATRPPRRWPTRSSAAASRSGPPTTSSGRSWRRPRRRVSGSTTCRTRWSGWPSAPAATPRRAELAADPAIGDALRGAAAIEGALASCDVIGGTAPTRVAAALRGRPGAAGRRGRERSARSARMQRSGRPCPASRQQVECLGCGRRPNGTESADGQGSAPSSRGIAPPGRA